MKVYVNPLYSHFNELIKDIISHQYITEHVFCNNRNIVELINVDGKKYVVKKYKRPTVANRFIYTFFRKPKAQRAYEHAETLKEKGFMTPSPVAYILLHKHGIFDSDWFISEYVQGETLRSLLEKYDDMDEYDRLTDDLLKYTLSLHQTGICPGDYNSGNLIIIDKASGYRFSIVDINRMKFNHTPGVYEASVSLAQCGRDKDEGNLLAVKYAAMKKQSSVFYLLSCKLWRSRYSWHANLKSPLKKVVRLFRSRKSVEHEA